MYPKSVVLVRFDFALSEHTDQVIDEFQAEFGEESNRLNNQDLRENLHRDLTFTEENPTGVFNPFESLAVRVVEATTSVTEIITIASVSREKLVSLAFSTDTGNRGTRISDWEYSINAIQRWIPSEEQGPETTVFWVEPYRKPNQLTPGSLSPVGVQTEFQDGVTAQFLSDFNTSASRGVIVFNGTIPVFLGEPDRVFGRLLALDLEGALPDMVGKGSRPAFLALQLPDGFAVLSHLLATHYWCIVRGKQMDEIEQQLESAKSELPGGGAIGDAEDYLDVEPQIYQIQQRWATLHGRIPGEKRELSNRLDDLELSLESTELRYERATGSGDDSGIVESYINSLSRQFDEVSFDEEQNDDLLDSLSRFTDNQLSAIATRENITLQRHVFYYTALVAILTVVLTLDSLMTGGLAALLDGLVSGRTWGVSNQWWLGGVTLGLAVVFSFALYMIISE